MVMLLSLVTCPGCGTVDALDIRITFPYAITTNRNGHIISRDEGSGRVAFCDSCNTWQPVVKKWAEG
jgi:hypothetical protein